MKLVFLSWSFPPMPYPRATQVQRLATHTKMCPLEIYCLAPSGDSVERFRDSSGGFDLVRIPRTMPTRVLERLFAPRRHRTLQEYDVKYLWWRQAARLIVGQGLTKDDVLVTFGQPMVDHLAGLEIKRKTGVRWVAHFSDPWADNPFDPNAGDWAASEKAVLKAADVAIFTSQESSDLVFSKYPVAWRAKARVLPHAFDASLYADSHKSENVTVRYVGNLFAGRGPESLFDALAILNDRLPSLLEGVRFEFIGEAPAGADRHSVLSKLPPSLVRFLPKVSYRESLALMKSSDLLLNIDAPASLSVFLPSKLVEYVGAGQPIFGITPPGTAAKLIGELGGWTADPAQPEQIASRLADALAYVARRQQGAWGNASLRDTYEAGAVAASFEKIIAQIPNVRQ